MLERRLADDAEADAMLVDHGRHVLMLPAQLAKQLADQGRLRYARKGAMRIEDHHEATIGGYVLKLLGRLPEVGAVIELDGYRAEVAAVEDARVTALRLEPKEEPS